MLAATFTIRPNDNTAVDFTRVGDSYEIVTSVNGQAISTDRQSADYVTALVGKAEAEGRI